MPLNFTQLPARLFILEAEAWMWQTPCHPEEEALIKNAAATRQQEFRAGRHCLHALLQMHHETSHAIIGRNVLSQPLLPDTVCGSLSHKHQRCFAATAWHRDYAAIGVDIEQLAPLNGKIWAKVFTTTECEHLLTQVQPNISASILFSAKEAVFKTLSVYTARHQTPETAQHQIPEKDTAKTATPMPKTLKDVSIIMDFERNTFSCCNFGAHTSGQYCLDNAYIYSVAYLENASTPC